MADHFTNMDSLWLQMLAEDIARVINHKDEQYPVLQVKSRLLAIAENLQRMDELNQTLSNNRSYADGYAAAEAAMRRRSNVLTNPEGEDAKGQSILDQINKRVAEGNLKRVPLGERALEDKPHEFNARVRKTPAKPKLAIDLDLSMLGDL